MTPSMNPSITPSSTPSEKPSYKPTATLSVELSANPSTSAYPSLSSSPTCAEENQSTTQCTSIYGGAEFCCPELVCHKYQGWKCVKGK